MPGHGVSGYALRANPTYGTLVARGGGMEDRTWLGRPGATEVALTYICTRVRASGQARFERRSPSLGLEQKNT